MTPSSGADSSVASKEKHPRVTHPQTSHLPQPRPAVARRSALTAAAAAVLLAVTATSPPPATAAASLGKNKAVELAAAATKRRAAMKAKVEAAKATKKGTPQ